MSIWAFFSEEVAERERKEAELAEQRENERAERRRQYNYLDILYNDTNTFEEFEDKQEKKIEEEEAERWRKIEEEDAERWRKHEEEIRAMLSPPTPPTPPKPKKFDLWRDCEDGIRRHYILNAYSMEEAIERMSNGEGHRPKDDEPCSN